MNIDDIITAREKMMGTVHQTNLEYSSTFSKLTNNEIYLKLENLQKTGSFKVRGAFNKVHSLTEEELKRGVIAASAGNHAQGVAFSASAWNIPCTIVMPKGAPISKIQATENYGAKVVLEGETFDDANNYARHLQQETGATFIHAFDDEGVIVGQGTIGLEILEQLPDVDAVVCPIGGGGLIAGIATAIKEINPNVKIYGVQTSAVPSMKRSVAERNPIMVNALPTMADGIAVKKPGDKTFEIVQNYVDDIVLVDEMEIARTMLLLLERNKLLVEGSGAAALASLIYGKLPLENKNVVCLVSGGNVDVNFISKIIERGLVESGRYTTFKVILNDKPGELEQLLHELAVTDANIRRVIHHHAGKDVLPGYVQVEISVETRNKAHIEQIDWMLKEKYMHVEFI
nr:threonine ammonia-lyase [Oceanobacillus luteolus]